MAQYVSPRVPRYPCGTPDMLRLSMLSFALIVALGMYSKSDTAGANDRERSDESMRQTAYKATGDDSDPSAAKQPAQKAAGEAGRKGHEKQKPSAVNDRAKPAGSSTVRRWAAFQAVIKKCVGVPLSAREQCLAE